MKSITQLCTVFVMPAVVSSCMCMMPMEKMDMSKDKMGQMDMGHKGQVHEMAGTKTENRQAEKRVDNMRVAFTTIPQKPTTGENILRVKLIAPSGDTIRDAIVTFNVTMAMPGMTVTEEKAVLTKEVYQADTNFGMAGQWLITVKIIRAGDSELQDTFTVTVT